MHQWWEGEKSLWLAAEEQLRRRPRQNRTSPVNLSPLYCRQLPASLQPGVRRSHTATVAGAVLHLPWFHSVMGNVANRFRALVPRCPGSSSDRRARGEMYVDMEFGGVLSLEKHLLLLLLFLLLISPLSSLLFGLLCQKQGQAPRSQLTFSCHAGRNYTSPHAALRVRVTHAPGRMRGHPSLSRQALWNDYQIFWGSSNVEGAKTIGEPEQRRWHFLSQLQTVRTSLALHAGCRVNGQRSTVSNWAPSAGPLMQQARVMNAKAVCIKHEVTLDLEEGEWFRLAFVAFYSCHDSTFGSSDFGKTSRASRWGVVN